nr:zinc transporter ZupT [Candidatus Sigynarchaeota archaeon]
MNVWIALLMSLISGLSTGIGALIAYIIKKPKLVYLSFSLGFSAGVMVYVSFFELLSSSIAILGKGIPLVLFFLGMLILGIIDYCIPEVFIPHNGNKSNNHGHEGKGENIPRKILGWREGHKFQQHEAAPVTENGKLFKTGLITAIGLAIHNFPEGMTTFSTTLFNINLGIVIMIAIFIHNIPEGISVSVPIFYATHDRKKAFKYSFLSGFAEPLGALITMLMLLPFLTSEMIAGLLALVAGIMIYISLDDILPTAHRYGNGHIVIIGTILGMFVMAVSLMLL